MWTAAKAIGPDPELKGELDILVNAPVFALML
jgi:hypothetical protein